jgi:hypothetical protein
MSGNASVECRIEVSRSRLIYSESRHYKVAASMLITVISQNVF